MELNWRGAPSHCCFQRQYRWMGSNWIRRGRRCLLLPAILKIDGLDFEIHRTARNQVEV